MLSPQDMTPSRDSRTILEMTRSAIIGGDIPDYLWPEVALAMVHVKNVRPTSALLGNSPHHVLENSQPSINHLRVLGSTVYMFIHEEKCQGLGQGMA